MPRSSPYPCLNNDDLKWYWTWISVNCLPSLTHRMKRHHLRRINRGGDPIATWQLLFPRLETASLRMINDKVEGQEVKLAGCPGIRHRNAITAVGLASAVLCAEISDASGVKLLSSIPKKERLKIYLALTSSARDLRRVSKKNYAICPNVECTIVWDLLAILHKISS